ncbi:hypothetical protein [Longimicrobium sp.]|uniref:hypothetical protein n=1 Tax=Longimicrobium sp. TaxID=2029185 RepID=UPI002ED938D8
MRNLQKVAGAVPAEAYATDAGAALEQPGAPRLSRSVAFVWGGEAAPAPSLPFGRWKPGARAA